MNLQDKLHRWATFTKACPFLTINHRGLSTLDYKGVKLLGYTENLFWGRLFYASFYVGGESPFYCINIRRNPPHLNEPSLTFKTDHASLSWQNINDLHNDSLRFFNFLKSDTATRIKTLAWPPRSLVDLRMWIGASLYLRDIPIPAWFTTIDRLILSIVKEPTR